jgi:hypothetical protein
LSLRGIAVRLSAPRTSSEVPMRMFRWMVLAVATILPAAPAIAQKYDPNYPVCIYVGKPDGNYINCSYTSWEQCRASASGRAAMCLDNPYWSHAHQVAPVDHRRRRLY